MANYFRNSEICASGGKVSTTNSSDVYYSTKYTHIFGEVHNFTSFHANGECDEFRNYFIYSYNYSAEAAGE